MKENKKKRSGLLGVAMGYLKIYGTGIFFAITILVIAYQFVEPAPPYHLTIATASKDGAYHKYGLNYKELLAEQGIELNLILSAGSGENLRLIKEKKVDAAFIQGGVGTAAEYPEIEGLASLYLEPLWIFTRKNETYLTASDFADKHIAAGPEGSGTRIMVKQVLADNGLAEPDVHLSPLTAREGIKPLLKGEIDILMTVTQIETPIIKELVSTPEVQLLNLKRAEAYSRFHNYLTHVVVPEGLVDMTRNVPKQDIHLIAPSATLVAHKDLHPALVDLLMQTIDDVHGKASVLADDEIFPSPRKLNFPLSKEARRYYKNGPPFLHKYLPFWAATLVDRLKVMLLPLVALVLPLMKILPPVYKWRIRSRIYRWYDKLHDLEEAVSSSDDVETATKFALKQLDEIEAEVSKIEVPSSYDRELYSLRLHIDMLQRKIKNV